MSETLSSLEQRREDLYKQLQETGDLRRGTISATFRIVGVQIERFHRAQADAALCEKVIPIKPVPRIYVSMDGTGVPVVKRETSDRRGKDGG